MKVLGVLLAACCLLSFFGCERCSSRKQRSARGRKGGGGVLLTAVCDYSHPGLMVDFTIRNLHPDNRIVLVPKLLGRPGGKSSA